MITLTLPRRGHVQIGSLGSPTPRPSRDTKGDTMTCETASNALYWLTLTLGGGRLRDAKLDDGCHERHSARNWP